MHALNPRKLPTLRQLKHLPKILSSRERQLFGGAAAATAGSLLVLAVLFYLINFNPVPISGGEYTEGLIGAPQYVNPLLSQTNDVDSDLARLIFVGLVAYDKNLQLVPDLAERWEIDSAQTTYTFVLRDNLVWHDGQPLTADDVVFTVQSVQDPDFKSPLLVSLRGVEVKKIDGKTINFILPEPYPDFLEVLTFGLLPEHIWGEIPPLNANLTEYNLKPVGAGPWQFKALAKDRLGNIKSYTLVPNQSYHGQKPYLKKLTFKFYPDFETGVQALKNDSIEGLSFLPKELKKELIGQKNFNQYNFSLPQYTAIFFNQKQNAALADSNIRRALALAIDKPAILSEALQLEGEIIDGPILPGFSASSGELPKIAYSPDESNSLLDAAGWKRITPEQYAELVASQASKLPPPPIRRSLPLNHHPHHHRKRPYQSRPSTASAARQSSPLRSRPLTSRKTSRRPSWCVPSGRRSASKLTSILSTAAKSAATLSNRAATRRCSSALSSAQTPTRTRSGTRRKSKTPG